MTLLEAAASDRARLDPADRRLLDALVQQQFWLFGADIRRPEGNLLLELGFERRRAPDPLQGSSCYLAPESAVGTVHLWGFGCCLTSVESGRIFLSRHKARAWRLPISVALEELHAVPQVHRLCRERWDAGIPAQLAALLQWFGSYEQRARALVGADVREAMLEPLGARRVCPAGELPERWDGLAAAVRSSGG